MNLFFVFDEKSDVSDGRETRRQADSIMDALYHPDKPRPEGEWIGGLITQQCVSSFRQPSTSVLTSPRRP